MREIDVPVLIVGGGGAGLSTSIFLSGSAVEHILIERHAGTSPVPKAHYLNQRTMEIFRAHELAAKVYEVGTPLDKMATVRWMTSLGGTGPLDARLIHGLTMMTDDYLEMLFRDSPCPPTNYPQMRLEPILRQAAQERAPGAIRFSHELVSWEQSAEGIISTIRDLISDETYIVRSRYMVGADGGRTVGPKLGIEMIGPRKLVKVVGVHIKADLSQYVPADTLLIRILNPEGQGFWASGAFVKTGPRWDEHSEEWMVHFAFDANDTNVLEEEGVKARIRDICKLPELDLEILRITQWSVDRVHAERVQDGRIFLIGDAAHQHPPTTGLGLNGAIQDAHNLAWKIGAVLNNEVSEPLLDSYEAERLPVAIFNCDWALSCAQNFQVIDASLGIIPGAPAEANLAAMRAYFSEGRVGASLRARVSEVINTQRIEFHAHDIEIGFNYEEGALAKDGTQPPERDPFGTHYTPTTRPGHRLPHAWLEHNGERVSTLDLCVPGKFLLITDADGEQWIGALSEAKRVWPALEIRSVSINNSDWYDPSGGWAAISEMKAGGALLVRPDQHVGWRSPPLADGHSRALLTGLSSIFGERSPDWTGSHPSPAQAL